MTTHERLTPAQQAGFEEGDLGVVQPSDDTDPFVPGSLVQLYHDDGSNVPLWVVVVGAGGRPPDDHTPMRWSFYQVDDIKPLDKGASP